MSVITVIVLVIHVLVSLAMIALILFQSGRGGGMSDLFGGGGGGMASMGTTRVERSFQRMTVFAGIGFAITTIALSILIG
jgi:preprotein translocase subunit SecG